MDSAVMLGINRTGWDEVAPRFRGMTALPVYGPLMPTEDELRLLDGVRGARVLEIGCGDGQTLKYMAERGASELHGLDLSPVQIAQARELLDANGIGANLVCSPMELDPGIPKGHFDIVLSIYALGWSTDLRATTALIHSYLRPGGYLVFSWEHPFYTCLALNDGIITMERPYTMEGYEVNHKWRGSSGVVMQRRMLSTYLNCLADTGFVIERLVEPVLPEGFPLASDANPSKWYNPVKAGMVPTTFVVKARKPLR